MTSHLTDDDLVLLYYREPGAPAGAARHLAECAECQAASASLTRTLSFCEELPIPQRSQEFGRDVWARLAPSLDEQPANRLTPSWRWWIAATTAAIVLATLFFTEKPKAPAVAGLSDQARDRVLASAVTDHLDRVQILLTEIANTGAADPERAEDLVEENRLMRQSLEAQGESAAIGFLDEVDPVLTEAAHTPGSAPPGEVNDLRDRIESGSLVFKVRVVESNLRSEGKEL
jgi:hypothetical protein